MGKMYYLGLDIGTNSVGYAVTDPSYHCSNLKANRCGVPTCLLRGINQLNGEAFVRAADALTAGNSVSNWFKKSLLP